MKRFIGFLVLLALCAGSPAFAKTLNATPATVAANISAALGGDTINLAPGDYGRITIANRNWSPPITIDATQAKLLLSIVNSYGIIRQGGASSGATATGVAGYANHILNSHDITFNAPSVTNSRRGFVIDNSYNISLTAPNMVGLITDGIDIAQGSHHITVDGARCIDFVVGPEHPDCIQGYSRPGKIVRDIWLRNITMNSGGPNGGPQGIFFGNKLRATKVGTRIVLIDDGGFDRVNIDTASLRGSMTNAVVLSSCRACSVKNVTAITMPGSRYKMSFRFSGTVTQSGNVAK